MKLSKFLFPSTIILAVGIWVSDAYSIALVYSVPLLIMSIIAGLFFFHARNYSMSFLLVLTTVFFIGCILTQAKNTTLAKNARIIPQKGFSTFRAKVIKPEEITDSRIRIEMKLLEVGGRRSFNGHNIKILAIFNRKKPEDFSSPFMPGQILKFSGVVLPPSSTDNPWEFDYQRYLNLQGISTVILIPSPEKIIIDGKEKPGIIERAIYGAREKLRSVITGSIPPPESSLLLGILLGKRKELPKELENSFRRSGTIHILAASGLHVSIVIAFFILLFRKLKFTIATTNLLTVIPVIFYALLAGGSPSITRASIMGVLFLLAGAVEKEYNPLRSLFFSALILLIINPYNLFNTGFQMSFSAVAGIIILYPFFISLLPANKDIRTMLEQKLSHKTARIISNGCYFLVSTVVVSVSAQLALLPVIAYYFNEISLVNLPANLILIPLTSVILPLGFIGGFAGMLFLPLGKFLLVYAFIPLNISIITASILGGSPFSSLTVPSPAPAFILLYYCFLLAAALKIPFLKMNRKFVLLLLVMIAGTYTVHSACKSVREQKITVFDTLHSTSVFVNHKNNSIMLIRLKNKAGKRALREIEWKTASYLKKKGIRKADILIISCREDTDPTTVRNISEIIDAKKLIVSIPHSSGKISEKALSQVLSPVDHIPVYDRDYEVKIKDAIFLIRKSGYKNTECISYKWNNGQMILADNENQVLKSLYRSDELLNNIILIVETLPSDMIMIDKMKNHSGENAFVINLSNLSSIKTRNLKKFPSPIKNKTDKGKFVVNNGAITFDVSSDKIHQVNSDKKYQEK